MANIKPITTPRQKTSAKKHEGRRVRSQKLAQKETKGEFGGGKKEYIVCSKCGIWYYDKSWHHALEDWKHLEKKDKKINFKTCPACSMITRKTYEGAVILENVPDKILNDLIALVRNVGERAFKRDPLDRIIDLKIKKNAIEIYLSENQLAVSISNQIKRSFKEFREKSSVRWSKEEDVVRVFFNALKSPERKRSTKARKLVYYGKKYIEK